MALLLNEKDVSELLTMEDAIDAVEESFRHWAQGGASMVPRYTMPAPEMPGQYYLRWIMSGTLRMMGVMGAKVLVAASPGTPPPRRGRFLVLLFDPQDGSLLALIEGVALTKIRTGAVTAVGTKYLSRESSATLGIFGSADYASMQAIAVCAVRPIQRIKVYSPTPEHRRRFAQEMERLLEREVIPVDTSRDAVSGSDIIVTVSNAVEPVFQGELLEGGTHINAVGSSIPEHREVDDQTVLRSKIVVEYKDQALKEAGDLVIPINNGVISPRDIYAEIAEVVEGSKPGRVSADEITLFKFNGIAIEDIACGLKVYQRAKELGRGAEVAF